jgi:hypothetical protein
VTYADVLVDVTSMMAEVARTSPAVSSSAMACPPTDETLGVLADRSTELGDTELGRLLHEWILAHVRFRRRLADLDEFRDNLRVA